MAYDIGPKIGIEGEKEFKDAIKQINTTLKTLRTEMQVVVSEYDKNDKSAEALTAQNEVLTKEIEAQKEKLDLLQKGLNSVKDEYGETSDVTQRWQQNVNRATAELNDMERKLKDNSTAAAKASDDYKSAEKSIDKMGDSAQDASKDADNLKTSMSDAGTSIKDVMKGVATTVAAVAAAITAVVSETKEFREDFAKLEVNAQMAGTSIKGVEDQLKYLDAITGETDSNIEGLSNLLQAGFKGNQLAQIVDELSGAVIKFPDTLKIESLADSLQETLATGSQTGQFGEMLGRLGINLDDFDAGLQKCTTSAQKQQYVLNTLAKTSLSEVSAKYRENNQDLLDNAAANYELRDSLSEIGAALTPLVTAVTEALAEVAGKLPEVFAGIDTDQIKDTITSLLTAVANFIGFILDNWEATKTALIAIGTGFAAFKIGNAVTQVTMGFVNFFGTLDKGKGIVAAFNKSMNANPILLIASAIAALVTAIVYLWTNCEDFRNFWIGLWESVKGFFEDCWNAICNFFTKTIPSAFQSVISFFTETIPEWWSNLWSGVAQIFTDCWNGIVSFFTETIPAWIESVVEWFATLPERIGYLIGSIIGYFIKFGTDAINWVTTDLPQIITGIVDWFAQLPGRIWEWLCQVVTNIAQWGQNVFNTATQWISQTVAGIIDWFAQLPGRIWEWLCNTVSSVAQWGTNLLDAGRHAGANVLNGVVDTIKSLPSKMLEIGRNIVDGLKQGIQNAWNGLTSSVGGFFDGLVNGVKDAMGIHSPSKVFAEIGQYMGAGVGVGFQNSMKTVGKQMQNAIPDTLEPPSVVGQYSASGSRGRGGAFERGQATAPPAITIIIENVNNYTEQDTDSLARTIAAKIQAETTRRGLVYG